MILWNDYASRWQQDKYGDNTSKLLSLIVRFRQLAVDPYIIVKTEAGRRQFESLMGANDLTFATQGNEKTKKILDILSSIGNEKVIIFSNFTGYLDELSDYLGTKRVRNTFVESSDTIKDRERKISAWKKSNSNNVLLMNYRIGSEGLNLTEATHVILVDTWFNFVFEKQAVARSHRIGQTRDVTVHRLLYKTSIETLLYNKSMFKSNIFEKIKNNQVCEDRHSQLKLDNMIVLLKALDGKLKNGEMDIITKLRTLS